MAKITRYSGNLKAFASESQGTERTIYGDVTQSNDLTDNINADYLRGLAAGLDAAGQPTEEDFNGALFTVSQLSAYLHQMGVAEWSGSQEYHVGSIVNRSGVLYVCKTDNLVNATYPESDGVNWGFIPNTNITTFGFKNHIINGNFGIWQRGASQTTSGYDSDDRWANSNVGSTKTHSRVDCTDTERALFNAWAFSRTVVTSVAGADSYVVKQQRIEDVTQLAGKTVTLSFWAKADSNKNIAIEFIQRFGTGGTPSAEVQSIGSQLVSLTTTWQKKTITVTLPSIVGKTLGTDGVHTSSTALSFWFDAGSTYNARAANLGQQSGTFDIAQVQLEEGSVATPFEQRPYGLELSLCQRYYELVDVYWRWDASLGGAATISVWAGFSQSKRVVPSVAVRASSNTNFSQGAIGANLHGFVSELSANNGGVIETRRLSTIYTASAEL